MLERQSAHARLHALLGDAAEHLSDAHLEHLEATLDEQPDADVMPTLLSHLQQMQLDSCADGTPWVEHQLHASRRNDMASTSRSLAGLFTVLRLLHAAQLTREDADAEQQLGDAEIDGLLHVARALVEAAAEGLHGRP